MESASTPVVDAHLHTWPAHHVASVPVEHPLARAFPLEEVVPAAREADVDRAVLVQARDSVEETERLLDLSDRHPFVAGVVGWLPLEDPDALLAAFDRYAGHPRFCGARHLMHEEADPAWLLRPAVLDGLAELERRQVPFDVVATTPDQLAQVAAVAEGLPALPLVVDHLGSPPVENPALAGWRRALSRLGTHPTVAAKVSGLFTLGPPQQPAASGVRAVVEHAIETFGADRLMLGSDWPVSTGAGPYVDVWRETMLALRGLSTAETAAVLGGTARELYLARSAVGRTETGEG